MLISAQVYMCVHVYACAHVIGGRKIVRVSRLSQYYVAFIRDTLSLAYPCSLLCY